jgi:hypothetical protein
MQAEHAAVDAEFLGRRRAQLAVEIIGPRVIRADEKLGIAPFTGADARTTVATGIVEARTLLSLLRTSTIVSWPTCQVIQSPARAISQS